MVQDRRVWEAALDAVNRHRRKKGRAARPSYAIIDPKRWIVERTFAWLGGFRRLGKDYEILTATAENMVRIAMLKITLAKCV